MAEAGGKESVGEQSLFLSHLLNREALSCSRDEVPVDAFGIAEREVRLCELVWGERGNPVVCGLFHLDGSLMSHERGGGKSANSKEGEEQVFHLYEIAGQLGEE